jgi:hypothetical protein
LAHYIDPDFPQTLRQAMKTPANSLDWVEIRRKLQHSHLIVVYVADPLAGFIAGIFVGYVQKKRTAIIAASCMVPGFLAGLSVNHVRYWASSVSRIAIYLGESSLPFITAIIAALLCRHLLVTRAAPSLLRGVDDEGEAS